jgi:hypothetical protein
MTPTQASDITTTFLGQGLLGAIVLVLAAVIVYLHLRNEKQRAEMLKEWADERKDWQATLNAEHRARLEDSRANQAVLLEVQDRTHEQIETLGKVADRLPLPRR